MTEKWGVHVHTWWEWKMGVSTVVNAKVLPKNFKHRIAM